MWFWTILLSLSRCHTSLCGGGGPRSPSLLEEANSLRMAWGCGAYNSTVPLPNAAAASADSHTLWSNLRDGYQLPIHDLFIPVDYMQAHAPPLVPPLQRDTQKSCLYLRLSFYGVATLSRLVKMTKRVQRGTIFPNFSR